MKTPMLSFDEAISLLLQKAQPVHEIEHLDTAAALGRVLVSDLLSPISVPALDTSAMDGYALRTADIPAADTTLPISQRIPAGHIGTPLLAGTAARIFTGALLPQGADAVVMQELCSRHDHCVTIGHLPKPGEAVRAAGSEVTQGAVVLPAGLRLRPQDIGMAASIGIAQLAVRRRLRVALFSTGDELKMPGEALPPGGVYNSNRFQLNALLQQLGCEISDFGIVPDRLDITRSVLRRAAEGHDLIVTSGGVSVGEEDHVKPAVEAEGALDLWQVAMKPGKPLAYGHVGATAFIGLPGNPVSGFITFLMLVRPYILATQGIASTSPMRLTLKAAFDRPKADARREFLRGRADHNGNVECYSHQGSAALSSTIWANGLIDVPAGRLIKQGDTVHFIPFSELLGG